MSAPILQKFPQWQPRAQLPRGVCGDRLGLYIHLPFCRTKCTYCAFVSGAPRTESEIDDYTTALCRQLHDMAHLADRPVETVFLGGGTPSLMGPARLERIFQSLHSAYNISPHAEITIEANPENVTPALFQPLIPLGLNRVSMGAQSFDDDELTRIGRVHNARQIESAVDISRKAGIDNISIDLIFALPGQTMETWQRSIKRALACGTSHLSTYGLSYEEGTHIHRQLNKGLITPVLEETYVEMYDALCDTLAQNGYNHYELSNWAKAGFECRHNLVYWHRDDYLAFGVSAHGTLGGWRFSWINDKERFMRALLQEGDWLPLLTKDAVELSTDEAASDVMIFGLRMTKGIDEHTFERRFGYTPTERWGGTIARFIQGGWLQRDGHTLKLTRETFLISNEVFEAFL